MTTYCLVLNYLLVPYTTDDGIAEAEGEIAKLKQPENMSSVWSSELLSENELRCGLVHQKARHKDYL